MKGQPNEVTKISRALIKQGWVPEREYIDAISAQWGVPPAKVKRALRQGAGNRFFKHVVRFDKSRLKRMYLFVDPVSARKWLAFALDRIVVEAHA